jgi:dipeptidyl-peptidase-4
LPEKQAIHRKGRRQSVVSPKGYKGAAIFTVQTNPCAFMKQRLLLLFILLGTALLAQKPITLEDIWQKGTFSAKGIPGFNFQKDGVHYTRLNKSAIEQCDLRTGAVTGQILDAHSIKTTAAGWKDTLDGYTFSADEQKILLATETQQIYRWSTKAQFFVYDQATQTLIRLYEGAPQRYAHFSPDGSKVAFVVDNDLYYKDLKDGKTTRITQDGKINAIINGASDWVYEEEFELVRAFEWSPDGKYLAFLRFDESEVEEMHMETFDGGSYPEEERFKYPKVGEKNAQISAWVYGLEQKKTVSIQTGADPEDYLPRIAWTNTGKLCLTKLNRLQNQLQLLLADPQRGTCSKLFEESNAAYLDLHDITFLKDGSGFVMQSEKSGFNHLYYYDMQGKQVAALTKGNWDVTDFYGIDEQNGLVFYQAASKSPMEREVFSVKLNGKSPKQLSKVQGYNSALFSSTYDYYVSTHSGLNTPPKYVVNDRKGKTVRVLEQNTDLNARMQEYGVAPVDFFNFKTPDQTLLNGFMLKPSDEKIAGKKLPVLMFVYGGPGSQQVLDQWKGANYWWFQMLVQQGYVVVCVDNRGTGARGESFKKCTYQQLGKLETQDQIDAAKYLGTLPLVDPTRVGIFGWSYGGYMSSLCMMKGGEVFKAGIAVAPVTNWKWYDSVYTERYMRTNKDNPEGYEQNSPVNFADKLQGKYLLVHGLADDNVHFQHSAEMSNRLIAANKQFDVMVYPNRSHSIAGGNARMHLYSLMTNFLNEKLKAEKPVIRP